MHNSVTERVMEPDFERAKFISHQVSDENISEEPIFELEADDINID